MVGKLFDDKQITTDEATYSVRDITRLEMEGERIVRIRVSTETNLDAEGRLTPESQCIGGDVLCERAIAEVYPDMLDIQIAYKIKLADEQIKKTREALNGR